MLTGDATELCALDPYYYTLHADGSVTVEFGAVFVSQQGTSGWAWTQLKLEWHSYID